MRDRRGEAGGEQKCGMEEQREWRRGRGKEEGRREGAFNS